ncbi:hydroxylamine reductase [Enterococcus sp. AZ192]|uniref:hydroxylamine reductase n=1 Tax=unclassified Enterococcus TaxID=2608891 RepID=UPI003D27F063
MENMFCFQCQETFNNTGCIKQGVCGKSPEVSNLQDGLIRASQYASDDPTHAMQIQVMENLFMTITNANFSKQDIEKAISKTYTGKPVATLVQEGSFQYSENEDLRSLRALVLFGLKGMSAYLHHAYVLGFEDQAIFDFLTNTLYEILEQKTMEEYLALINQVGEFGVKAMALLDHANTKTYGHPHITEVELGVGDRPGILVSGHDLHDLEELLDQSEGKGIDIYTHSEMLPAHYYPKFQAYEHFKGNYGGAWWKQREEFDSFNGPILMTTNCIVPVKAAYKNRIYTTGVVGYDGVQHIDSVEGKKDFSAMIDQALTCTKPVEIETGSIIGGFAHNQVFALKDQIVAAVRAGKIKKFVVMAGCDGRQMTRSYYTEFAEELPKDTVILTAGCAKYRYIKLGLGDIDGIPRVLDAGQCNDAYSLALIALKLQEVFELANINDLPIVYNIAWYEQKAVIVLLALLHLGIKNIHLGPTLPGYMTETVIDYLVETFDLAPMTNVSDDLEIFGLEA